MAQYENPPPLHGRGLFNIDFLIYTVGGGPQKNIFHLFLSPPSIKIVSLTEFFIEHSFFKQNALFPLPVKGLFKTDLLEKVGGGGLNSSSREVLVEVT